MEVHEFAELYSKLGSYENVKVASGEMAPLERFNNIMDFKKVDRVIDAEFGYWNDTLRRWHSEGLPSHVDCIEKADVYFGFDVWRKGLSVDNGLKPCFEPEVIEDNGTHKIMYDNHRVKCKVFSNGTDSIPHYLDFPIKDKASYQPFKERLIADANNRVFVDWAQNLELLKNRNYVLECNGGSTAGIIRNWMGFEGICMGIFEQPDLLEEILEDLSNVSAANARAVTQHISPDLIGWWEDIAFKNGPIVTPDFFIGSCGRAMKKVMDVYTKSGTRFAYVDCDGDFRALMPGWLNNSVNIMFPLEVASGVDPVDLRKNNSGIRMMGGVNKVVLIEGKQAIKKELLRIKPIVEEGGFIPHVDHRVQADVSYDNYLYYLEVKRDLFGMPNSVQV